MWHFSGRNWLMSSWTLSRALLLQRLHTPSII
jgi:hypothetical protein